MHGYCEMFKMSDFDIIILLLTATILYKATQRKMIHSLKKKTTFKVNSLSSRLTRWHDDRRHIATSPGCKLPGI